MSRSQQNQQLQTGNTMVANENANASTALNSVMPSYQQQLQSPGYTAAQQSGITNATTQGVGAAFGNAVEGATNAAARTNNTAGLTANQDALARQRMITSGNLGAQNQVTFANDAQKQEAAAQAGLSNIFGTSTGAANTTLGVNAKNAATPSFWDEFGNAAAKSLGSFDANFGSGGASGGFGT